MASLRQRLVTALQNARSDDLSEIFAEIEKGKFYHAYLLADDKGRLPIHHLVESELSPDHIVAAAKTMLAHFPYHQLHARVKNRCGM